MEHRSVDQRLHPAWWTVILLVSVVATLFLCAGLFFRTFHSFVPVTLAADRSGLVMESGAKVKLRGVQVGVVKEIRHGNDSVSLQLQIDRDRIKHIPANIQARIGSTTVFGNKYVDLIYPSDPSPKPLAAGTVIKSQNVSTEVNTVFQNLLDVLHQIDPAKLNGVLTALAEGVRGQGPRMGEAITDANQVLLAINPRADTARRDWQAFKGFSDTYGAAAQDILTVLDAASTTSVAITDNAKPLDDLLLNAIGFGRSGINLVGPAKDNLVKAINVAEPSTRLLMKYNPSLTCMLVGGKLAYDRTVHAGGGGNGKSLIVDAALLLGDDPYLYPQNLPITGAKGGPGGEPGCGSLPDVEKNFPHRQLITNTGYGTGTDWRPNPGIGFPGWVNYFPVTRGTPEPPSLRYAPGPALGPEPYLGAPPYGAPMYAPDGTPLYPGLPEAPPPGRPQEPGPPPPGSGHYVVPAPGVVQPTPTMPIPEQSTP